MRIDDLPQDWRAATLVGRLLAAAGPIVVISRGGRLSDVTAAAPTVADLLRNWTGATPEGRDLGQLEDFDFVATPLLAPFDLQVIKAAGVTFALSAVERVIEERARGDAAAAEAIRGDLSARVGGDIRAVQPGSEAAARLKAALIAEGLWSQYLEVAIGPDAEIFTKAPILAAVGHGAQIGVRSDSTWNNPEPEVVLACDPAGRALGATLGNDVNLRDFEGRSALLLSKAKDNNASCAIGPFLRMFDDGFTINDVRAAKVDLVIEGRDNYRLEGQSSMDQMSRDPLDLVRQTLSEHQYPDGFALFLGTLFAPTQDRDEPGRGFTHRLGDRVRISSPRLGRLANEVTTSKAAAPWSFGVGELMRNLAGRGLLAGSGVLRDGRDQDPGVVSVASAIYPSLKNKRVVITGGGSGIGAGLVEAFARQGAEVHFLDILGEASARLTGALADAAPVFHLCDLRDLDAAAEAFARIGPIDVLVNNAGNDDRHSLDDLTPAYFDDRMAVNLRHMLFCAKWAAKGMQARGGGAIVNLGSISWHLGLTDLVLYETAKAGIEGMTRALARELGRDAIRVTCVVPGNVRTPRQQQWYTPEGEAEIVAAQCLEGRISPADVAALVMFLASDDARYCTGHAYWIDAGWR